MKKSSLLITLCGLATSFAIGLPAQAEPPPWAPAHGHRAKEVVHEYRYVYYPAQQVYYAPETHNWFWMNGGNWQMGVTLPSNLRVNASNGGVSVALNSPQPYVQHVYVEEHYGRPWREKHKHKHKDDHRDHHEHYDRDDRHHEHGRHERDHHND